MGVAVIKVIEIVVEVVAMMVILNQLNVSVSTWILGT